DLSAIANDKDYTINLKLDIPATPTIPEFTFISTSDAVPGSLASVCLMLARQANAALASAISGASITCVASSDGKRIRVTADVPGQPDAQITFDSGTTNDADAFLKLSDGNTDANVSQYWPASNRGADAFAQKDASAGTDGSGLPEAGDLIGDSSKF